MSPATEASIASGRPESSSADNAPVELLRIRGLPTGLGHRVLPVSMQLASIRWLMRLARIDQARDGLPRPEHPLGAEHPAVSADLLSLIRDESIDVKRDVKIIEGTQ